MQTLEAVTVTYRESKLADRYGWPKLICDAYCAHLEAITRALEAGATGRQIDEARRA